MSRDEELLKSVSDLFTEKTLRDIVIKTTEKTDSENVEILSWDFCGGNTKGDSYLSVTNKIGVKAEIDGKVEIIRIFVKSLPKNMGLRKTFRISEFFRNEIHFYSEILPRFQEFAKSRKASFMLCVPKCLSYLLDGENDFLVLEDVKVLGYDQIPRNICIDYTICCSMLRSIARFHAISFAYKDQIKDGFAEIQNCLEETYYSENLWNWYQRFEMSLLRIAKDALFKEYPGSAAERKFQILENDQLYKKCIDLCSRTNAPTSVVCQGDCWAPNFLIRDSRDNEKTVLTLDFQLARWASPVLDIAYMIYSCTDQELRDRHFDEFLKLYHDELSKSISQLGSDPEILYPWETFMNEVKEQFVFGCAFALESVPFSLLTEKEAPDLDIVRGDDAVNIADVWILNNLKNKLDRRRLADVIVDAVHRGFL